RAVMIGVRPHRPPRSWCSGTPLRQPLLAVPPGVVPHSTQGLMAVWHRDRRYAGRKRQLSARRNLSLMANGADEFIETERKYDAAAGFALPDLAGLDGVATVTRPQTYRLRAIYFDTADFRLATAKITLRRRTGGTDAGW